MSRKYMVSVIGGHECDEKTAHLAEKVGNVIAEQGAVLVCGGLGGVMESVCKGAKASGGFTVGIIPGDDKSKANEFVDIVITSDMGYSRNTLVAGTPDMVVALSGAYGTLSEISFALISGKDVYGFGTWDIPDVKKLNAPEELREIIKNNIKG
ncbi:MAG: TIGR00725 family protein [Candidatus Omnitrophota bacterium]